MQYHTIFLYLPFSGDSVTPKTIYVYFYKYQSVVLKLAFVLTLLSKTLSYIKLQIICGESKLNRLLIAN